MENVNQFNFTNKIRSEESIVRSSLALINFFLQQPLKLFEVRLLPSLLRVFLLLERNETVDKTRAWPITDFNLGHIPNLSSSLPASLRSRSPDWQRYVATIGYSLASFELSNFVSTLERKTEMVVKELEYFLFAPPPTPPEANGEIMIKPTSFQWNDATNTDLTGRTEIRVILVFHSSTIKLPRCHPFFLQ
ncbi:hypothetical protein V1478_002902 [Vespula squamosa]|uniref:Uncharacterized protein n=1 Tax=Vespula squamosa TaxID=30214 RepID=A0ABD2BR61_VESSQ